MSGNKNNQSKEKGNNHFDNHFIRELKKLGHADMEKCLNCGNCTSICPLGLEYLPRRLFKLSQLGMVDKIMEHKEVIFLCLLCRRCEASCPRSVSIADNMRVLRNYINKEIFNNK